MKNLILAGFMGSGKTAVGQILADKFNREFIDTDKVIEERADISVTDIFKKKGEQYFRTLEKQVIADISIAENKVISVGGGAVLDSENVENLKKNGMIIYLKAPFNVLYDRIKESANRPLLAVHNPEEAAQALLEARQLAYESIADLVIDVSNGTPEEIAEEIAGKCGK